jgi:hypothetical protein
MDEKKENPEQRGNAATGPQQHTPQERPKRKPQIPAFDKNKPFTRSLRITTHEGNVVEIDDKTRLANVVQKMMKAGQRGVSVLDFPPGVRLSACIHKLRRWGAHIDTQRQKVASDPYGQRIAVYRFTQAKSPV